MSENRQKYVSLIKSRAASLGFSGCGISVASFLESEAKLLEEWLKAGMNGSMGYMDNHFDKRVDPRKLVNGAKSVISVMYNYYPSAKQKDPNAPVLSKYAYGRDYHFVLKDKLRELLLFMNESIGGINGRAFVDSAPVLEKAWAARSGLGWVGKNSNLLVKTGGSFFFLGELIVDIELPADTPVKDHCGRCRLCMDACPTNAIVAPGRIDARKCISYLTVEYREALPSGMRDNFNNRVFGCDICQDVCPWNKRAVSHREPSFNPLPELLDLDENEWYSMDRERYNRLFKDSALSRAGFRQLRRNIEFLTGSSSDRRH